MAGLTPEARGRRDAWKAGRVKPPRLEDVERVVPQTLEAPAGAPPLLWYGPSGVGQSTVAKRLTERVVAAAREQARSPGVWVAARPSDTGGDARLDAYRQGLTALQGQAAGHARLRHLALTARSSRTKVAASEGLDRREAVEEARALVQVKAVELDEAQHLLPVTAPLRPVAPRDWRKSLTHRAQGVPGLVGPYALCEVRQRSGQAARRGRDLPLPRYPVARPDERQAFVGALRSVLAQVPLTGDGEGLLTPWRWLAEGRLGCIGLWRAWLVDTVAAL